MDIHEIIEKIGEGKLRAAIESDDADALKQTLAESGVEITDEQLDYIAGGLNASWSDEDRHSGLALTCVSGSIMCITGVTD